MNPMDQDMNTYQIVIDEFYPICINYIKNENFPLQEGILWPGYLSYDDDLSL